MVLSKQVLIIQHKFPIRNKDESLSYQNSDEVNINRYQASQDYPRLAILVYAVE